jgi:hypothetical protein
MSGGRSCRPEKDDLVGQGRSLIEKVRELVESARRGAGEELAELVPNMPAADLAVVLRQALIMAELTGRNEIGTEAVA